MEKINIRFTKKAYEEYLNLPLNYKELLDRTLERFEQGIPIDIKPIHGVKDTYRIRFGKYRLIFIKISSDILIVRIKKRDDIYK
jgi:mRNA-degrading endonuclease RelE of RelBE toxin-antitoxin system